VSALDVFVGWVEADSVRETVASVAGCVVVALAIVGAVFLARHTTADAPAWWRARRERKSAAKDERLTREVLRAYHDQHIARWQRAPQHLVDRELMRIEAAALRLGDDAEGVRP
jgi:hypothetical protein